MNNLCGLLYIHTYCGYFNNAQSKFCTYFIIAEASVGFFNVDVIAITSLETLIKIIILYQQA